MTLQHSVQGTMSSDYEAAKDSDHEGDRASEAKVVRDGR